jgi:hypothetical protein
LCSTAAVTEDVAGTRFALTNTRFAGRPRGAKRSRSAFDTKMYADGSVLQDVRCTKVVNASGAVASGDER